MVSLATSWNIVPLNRVKEAIIVDTSPQLQQHKQDARLSRVTYLVQVALSAKIGFMFFRIAKIKNSLDVVTGMLRVFDIDVYALLYQGDTFISNFLYNRKIFSVSPDTLSGSFSILF